MLVKHQKAKPAVAYVPAVPAQEEVPERFILEFTKEQLHLWLTVTGWLSYEQSGMTFKEWDELQLLLNKDTSIDGTREAVNSFAKAFFANKNE